MKYLAFVLWLALAAFAIFTAGISCGTTGGAAQPDPCECFENLELVLKEHPEKNSHHLLILREAVEECLADRAAKGESQ